MQPDRALWRTQLVLGIDEAGLGPLAGDLYAACVAFFPFRVPAGLADSKQLTPKQREQVYPYILEQAQALGVGTASVSCFDKFGAAHAWRTAMQQALQRCLRMLQLLGAPPRPAVLLIDGVRPVPHDVAWLQSCCAPRMDARSPTVGAASIVAKVERDAYMARLDAQYPQYGFSHNQGYGTRQHLQALVQHGAVAGVHRAQYVSTALANFRRGT